MKEIIVDISISVIVLSISIIFILATVYFLMSFFREMIVVIEEIKFEIENRRRK